jgi:hypothetical protein
LQSLSGLGGLARFLAGVYLVYFLGVFQAVYLELERASFDVRYNAYNIDYVGERLNVATANIINSLESSLAPRLSWLSCGLSVVYYWHLGGII